MLLKFLLNLCFLLLFSKYCFAVYVYKNDNVCVWVQGTSPFCGNSLIPYQNGFSFSLQDMYCCFDTSDQAANYWPGYETNIIKQSFGKQCITGGKSMAVISLNRLKELGLGCCEEGIFLKGDGCTEI